MQLDIYRDDELEKCLIVRRGQDIKKLSAVRPDFLKGMSFQRDFDSDFDKLPTGLNKNEVLSAIEEFDCYAVRSHSEMRQIDT